MPDWIDGSPEVAAKLARLTQLEADFQRTLETEKLEAMAEFAAGAGHEINNPLTVISGRAQLLLRDETEPERRHALALISAQAMRVYEMIADMMLFARPPRPERQSVDLIALLDQVVADLSPPGLRTDHCADGGGRAALPAQADHAAFSAVGTEIHRTGEPGPLLIDADPCQLQVALRAVCQNAVQALGNTGHVEIRVSVSRSVAIDSPGPDLIDAVGCQGALSAESMAAAPTPAISPVRWVEICIHDDGPGITPDERRHIFDPFYSARQAGRGLGLGLAKAWRIITNHGGRIEVASQPGHGAAFTITLPERE